MQHMNVAPRRRLACKSEQQSEIYLQISLFFEQEQWEELAQFVMQQLEMYKSMPHAPPWLRLRHMLSCLLDHIATDLPTYDGPCLNAMVEEGVVGQVLQGMEDHPDNGDIQVLGAALLMLLHDEVRTENTDCYDRPDYDFGMLFGYLRQDDDGHLPVSKLLSNRAHAVFRITDHAQRIRMIRVVIRAIENHGHRYHMYVWGLDLMQFVFAGTFETENSMLDGSANHEQDAVPLMPAFASEFIANNGILILFRSAIAFVQTYGLHVAINAVVWSFWQHLFHNMQGSARVDFVTRTVEYGGVDFIIDALHDALAKPRHPCNSQRIKQLTYLMANKLVLDHRGDVMCQQYMNEDRLVISGLLLRYQITPVSVHKTVATMLLAMCHSDTNNAMAIAKSNVLVDFMSCFDHLNHAISRGQRKPCKMTLQFLLLLQEICSVPAICRIVAKIHDVVAGQCAVFLCLLDILCKCHRMRGNHLCLDRLLSIMHSIAAATQHVDLSVISFDHPGKALLTQIAYDGHSRRYSLEIQKKTQAVTDHFRVHPSLYIAPLRRWPPRFS